MKSFFYHIQINVSFEHLAFYKELMIFLGWQTIFEMSDVIGFKSEKNGDLWFVNNLSKGNTDYDQKGMNHLSIRVEKLADIEELVEFLKDRKVKMLFETPRHRPEFSSEPTQTYFQVMFTSPDNILFEVVYVGEKKVPEHA